MKIKESTELEILNKYGTDDIIVLTGKKLQLFTEVYMLAYKSEQRKKVN